MHSYVKINATFAGHRAGRRMKLEFESKLTLISQRAANEPSKRFSNLMHLVNTGSLTAGFRSLKKNKAPGVDGESIEVYGAKLGEHLGRLLERMKQMSYRPQPVRRVYIPKANGKQR